LFIVVHCETASPQDVLGHANISELLHLSLKLGLGFVLALTCQSEYSTSHLGPASET